MRTMTVNGKPLVIRPAQWQEIVDLRHAILRQGLPRSEAIFEGDDLPSSRHTGAFRDTVCVGCATLHSIAWEGEPAWQLRGMATAPDVRRTGVGRALLESMEAELIDARRGDPATSMLLWCNARVPAVGFYEAMGWRVVSGLFEIPTAGPHFRMLKRLDWSPTEAR